MTFALRDYQEQAVADVRGAFKAGSGSVLLVLATGAGKCLAKDTPVLMYDGTAKLVQDILPGELLMGPDSKPRRVLSLARGREMMYRVTPTKGDPYTVNESHILSLRTERGGITNICVSDYLRMPAEWRSSHHGWRVPGVLQGDTTPFLVHDIKVEPVGDGDYYGFEIDGPDRLFLLGDFTVTHNTVIFSHIAKNAAEMGNNVLILAHRDQLIKQASRKLRDYGVRHGIIMAGFTPDMTARVQVASVQTLVRRLGKFKWQPKLIVIDETHLAAAKSYRQILDHFHGARILGVTGSPCRLDGKPLGRQAGGIFDHMVTGISIRQLIDRGFLVQPVVYAPAEQLDLSSVHVSKGDFDTTELAAVVDKPQITGSAVAHYQRICPGEPAVAWCVNLAHAEHVAAEFNAQGIKTMMLSGEDDGDTRDKALKALETGAVQVITFVGILIEGVDCPAISAIIMLRPTMSLSSYLQVIGRGLRPHTFAGGRKKTRCVVLDHAGLTFKHGLADEERDWSLDDEEAKKPGKKKKPEERNDVIQCVGPSGCFGVWRKDDSPLACPHCGNPVPVKEARALEHAEGELAEITPEMAEAMRAAKRNEVRGAKTLEELQRIAAARGYSPGWARATFEAKQRTRQKYQRQAAPPEPSLSELKNMTLEQLTRVAREQGWPHQWPSEFYHSQRNLGE